MSKPVNAWRDPWIEVVKGNVTQSVSLRQLFRDAHLWADLGGGLTPLDRDSLLRLLYSIGATILRSVPDPQWPTEPSFPESALMAFETDHEQLFDLVGTANGGRPFLQRWDRTAADVDALVTAKKPIHDVVLPLVQLHPHEPGGSSSEWAVRRDARDANRWAALTQLLVTAWFQTKNGNGRDPWGGRHLKGSASTWHTNPLAIHLVDPGNLAATIWANIPTAWVEGTDLPLFLSSSAHGQPRPLPDGFVAQPVESVCRFTYAKTLPLLVLNGDHPIGFVLGEDATIPVPLINEDPKESLGRVHEGDPTRLYVESSVKGVIQRKPRGSWGTRLSTTEGFEKWFRRDFGIEAAVRRWRTIERLRAPSDLEFAQWRFGLLSETTDGKGNRQWADWSVAPAGFMAASGDSLGLIQLLLGYAADCKRSMSYALRLATGDSGAPAGLATAEAAFWSRTTPVIENLKAKHQQGTLDGDSVRQLAASIRRAAYDVFTQSAAPLATPAQVRQVAQAQRWFAQRTLTQLNKTFSSEQEAIT